MGFWKELGKAISHTVDEDIKRTRKASEKEAEARRLMDEAADLRRRSIFNIDSPRQTAQEREEERILRQMGDSSRRERATRESRAAAEERRDWAMVNHYLRVESREREYRQELTRDLNRVRRY